MKHKKDGRIIWQTAAIVYSITAAVVILAGVAMYWESYHRYTTSLYTKQVGNLERAKEEFDSYLFTPWLVEYWRTHEGELDPPIGARDYTTEMEKVAKILHTTDLEEEFWDLLDDMTPEDAAALPPEDQKTLASFMYTDWNCYLVWMQEMEPTAEFYGMYFDSEDKESTYILFDGNAEGDWGFYPHTITLGTKYPYSKGEYDAMKKLVEGNEDKPFFAMYPAVADGVPTGVIFDPVKCDGKVVMVLAVNIPMNEGVLRSLEMIEYTFTVLLVALWGMCTLLLFSLHVRVVRPIGQMQTHIREYTKDWDCDRLTTYLMNSRQHNEMGKLSDDLVLLAKNLEDHIEETAKLSAEKERVDTELSIAARIQVGVLPREFSVICDQTAVDIFASMVPAKEVGGDFYDFFLVDEDHLALVIGDVSGKGVPAALFMVTVKALIKSSLMAGEKSPAKALAQVSDRMCEGNEECMFVTVWLGVLTLSTGELICTNAGHDNPIIARKGELFAYYMDEHGLPLAIMEGVEYTDYTLRIREGDTIFVYTDGAPEAQNEKEEQFGEDRLLLAFNEIPDASCEQLIRHVTRRVTEFVGNREPFDDMTMLCLKPNSKKTETGSP